MIRFLFFSFSLFQVFGFFYFVYACLIRSLLICLVYLLNSCLMLVNPFLNFSFSLLLVSLGLDLGLFYFFDVWL